MRHIVTALSLLIVFSSLAFAADQPKIYITDSKSWEVGGGGGGTSDAFGGGSRGGARPQTAEIIKTFGERCPEVAVTIKQDKADYIVILDHEGGKSVLVRDNKVAVFDNHEGTSIFSHSTAILGNAVKDACQAIKKHWSEKGSAEAYADQKKATSDAGGPATLGAKVQVVTTPPGADIELDGAFVGTTPSSIVITPGDHAVVLKKTGFRPWVKSIRVTAGDVHLTAELEKLAGETHGQQ